MAANFAEIARKETTLSPLLNGRKTINTDEIIRNYPNGITVTDFDFIKSTNKAGETESYPVLCFAEDNTKAFFGGTVMSNICWAWVDAYAGDVKAASDDLHATGGVHVRFAKTRTKNGNTVTSVTVG